MNRNTRRTFLFATLAAGAALTPAGRAVAAAATTTLTTPTTTPTIEGSLNLRDIGGLAATPPYTVRHGIVYRSGTLSLLTDTGVGQLATLGLAQVVDFRTAAEIAVQGADRLPPGVVRVSAPIGDPPGQAQHQALGVPDPKQIALYQGYVSNPAWRASFADTLHRLLPDSQRPLLYHDSAGAHRAGWLTAILLTLLGVPRAQVDTEYLASNDALGGVYAYTEYLDAAFAQAGQDFGSFHGFLSVGLGMSPAQLARLHNLLLV
ncbi:tyrosine-protein phosphatase [Actinokineospora enzanensis]|uniref:tyrosine-protein phosphatase n=1 Tax=Actinokineospora enzanensis TaxID=155975 RepID=UPI00037B55EA|nr:tyrosine-protein phosphatase [Actinokineospora enzanensis]